MKIIAVEITVEDDQVEAFKAGILRHAANTRKEEGCQSFEVAQDNADATRFLIWECYRDDDAVEAHKNAPYLAEFRAAAATMVKSRNLTVADLLS